MASVPAKTSRSVSQGQLRQVDQSASDVLLPGDRPSQCHLTTYEQIPVRELVGIVEAVDSPAVGICLDPGNCVAGLELPVSTVELTARHVRNVHVKDFAFSRRDGWVGFTFAGCPLGEGLLDYRHLVDTVRPGERGLSQIIEHWLPWQGDSAATIAEEDRWTVHHLSYLRSQNP